MVRLAKQTGVKRCFVKVLKFNIESDQDDSVKQLMGYKGQDDQQQKGESEGREVDEKEGDLDEGGIEGDNTAIDLPEKGVPPQ